MKWLAETEGAGFRWKDTHMVGWGPTHAGTFSGQWYKPGLLAPPATTIPGGDVQLLYDHDRDCYHKAKRVHLNQYKKSACTPRHPPWQVLCVISRAQWLRPARRMAQRHRCHCTPAWW